MVNWGNVCFDVVGVYFDGLFICVRIFRGHCRDYNLATWSRGESSEYHGPDLRGGCSLVSRWGRMVIQ